MWTCKISESQLARSAIGSVRPNIRPMQSQRILKADSFVAPSFSKLNGPPVPWPSFHIRSRPSRDGSVSDALHRMKLMDTFSC